MLTGVHRHPELLGGLLAVPPRLHVVGLRFVCSISMTRVGEARDANKMVEARRATAGSTTVRQGGSNRAKAVLGCVDWLLVCQQG